MANEVYDGIILSIINHAYAINPPKPCGGVTMIDSNALNHETLNEFLHQYGHDYLEFKVLEDKKEEADVLRRFEFYGKIQIMAYILEKFGVTAKELGRIENYFTNILWAKNQKTE